MSYITGVSRDQVVLFPESIDDYITEDNPVRFIDAFVDHMNLHKLGFTRAEPAKTCRPGYEPKDLTRSCIYMDIRTGSHQAVDWSKKPIATWRWSGY